MTDQRTGSVPRSLNEHPFVVAVVVVASFATILGFVAADPFRWWSGTAVPPGPTVAPDDEAALPADFVGHWQGQGQSDADTFLQFTIALDLRDGHVGSAVGSAWFEGNFHAGSFGAPAQYGIILTGVTSDGVQVSEQGGFDDVVLQLDGRTMIYHARNRGEPVYWVTATLSHIS